MCGEKVGPKRPEITGSRMEAVSFIGERETEWSLEGSSGLYCGWPWVPGQQGLILQAGSEGLRGL